MSTQSNYLYTPHYCEENVWQAARHPDFKNNLTHTWVVFISNAIRQCPIWAQRASLVHGNPVVWDYHVILLVARPDHRPQIWDFDTLLGAPTEFETWWGTSFPFLEHLTPPYQPLFRVIPAEEYIEHFSSDRRHMRDHDGNWRMPPPEWPMIFDGEHTLPDLVDMSEKDLGTVLDHHEFYARFHHT